MQYLLLFGAARFKIGMITQIVCFPYELIAQCKSIQTVIDRACFSQIPYCIHKNAFVYVYIPIYTHSNKGTVKILGLKTAAVFIPSEV